MPSSHAKYAGLREEAVKNKVAEDYFSAYEHTDIIGNIDFCIAKKVIDKNGNGMLFAPENKIASILWAEAKKGVVPDINESFVQLILTIGKARTFNSYIPPYFLGAFDAAKIAFIPYHKISAVFSQNDFNWNVTPSNHGTKEFSLLYNLVQKTLDENSLTFDFIENDKELREFIKKNFVGTMSEVSKIQIDKNNFTYVFQKWTSAVKPTISVDWDLVNKAGLLSADFFLADLLSENNKTLKEKLYILLDSNHYELDRKIDEMGFEESKKVGFSDKQRAHKAFWSIYERPPKRDYWEFFTTRRELLVPQDIRERKGSFFTPQIWVQKSQEYLAQVLGENWQDEYFIWDCCAGTGNLLNGLTNYRNVWASTIDKADVDVMKDRIENGWKMFENHVFQFDFLNDEFLPQNPEECHTDSISLTRNQETLHCEVVSESERTKQSHLKGKVPNDLYEILTDEEKRKRLVIYINPPYAEAGNKRQISDKGRNKSKVSFENKIYEKWSSQIGTAAREIYAEFLIRIYSEIQCCKVAHFAKLKALCAPNFAKFRSVFQAKLEKLFVVPANTFDNVKGQFPIGFFILDMNKKPEESKTLPEHIADVYDANGDFLFKHSFYSYDNCKFLLHWIRQYYDKDGEFIAYLRVNGQDMQNNMGLFLTTSLTPNDLRAHFYFIITKKNILQMSIYFAVRQCIPQTWLNDRDQFLFPNDGWKTDFEFQSDCLIFTLFNGQNRISCEQGTNYWIPFTEEQVGSKNAFKSDFMSRFLKDFLNGKVVSTSSTTAQSASLFDEAKGGVAGDLPPLEGVASNEVRARGRDASLTSFVFDFDSSGKQNSLSPLSKEAQSVYDVGLELWRYYHTKPLANPDASFYDIRKYFQGETAGRMNSDSNDERYSELIAALRAKMKSLAAKIAPKVYEFGFLK